MVLFSSLSLSLSLPLPDPSAAPLDDRLFGAVVQRLVHVASGKEEEAPPPDVPRFPIGVCVLGKPFAGESTSERAS